MKFQVLQSEFAKALSVASRFASAKAQLPVLGNVLLKTQKNKLLISATNLELSITLFLGAQISDEGEITVPARAITDIIANLPNKPVEVEVAKESIKITSENFESSLSGMNSGDFPSIPTALGKGSMELSRDEFLDALSKVLFAVSADEARAAITGVLFVFEKEKLTLVATDGFRLSRRYLKAGDGTEMRVIIPKNILSEISRLSEGSDTIGFAYKESDNQVVFAVPGAVVASRVIDGQFPDYERIIPKSHAVTGETDKTELLRAIKVAAVFAKDSANIIKMSFKKKGIGIAAESKALGNQLSRVDADIEGEGVDEIAFNYKFVEDVLGAIEGERVNMEFKGVDAAGVFKDPKDQNFLHLIMPVKIEG